MLNKISVTDYMAQKLITFTRDTNVSDAIKKMIDYKITSAPVIGDQGELIGMFSERDCINVVIDAAYNQGMAGKVGDFMTTEIVTIDADASILDVAEKFHTMHVRSFPVFQDVDLVGVISRTDVLRAMISM
jgi:CBS domain-containing protein